MLGDARCTKSKPCKLDGCLDLNMQDHSSDFFDICTQDISRYFHSRHFKTTYYFYMSSPYLLAECHKFVNC